MVTAQFAAPTRARTAHEHARTALRAAILDGTLAAGARLLQTELAAALGVSTTPVREALRDLATEGLVVFDPHRGALVRALALDEVREIYELRIVLEPLMVARVIDSITDAELDRAAGLCRDMDREPHISRWVELNRDFHAVFGKTDEGSRLATILAGLRDSAAAYVAVSLQAESLQIRQANDEHRRLVDIYRRRDEDAAVRLTVQHLQSTLAAVGAGEAERLL